jgi:peptidoglycan hydrolase CwlO-like protein
MKSKLKTPLTLVLFIVLSILLPLPAASLSCSDQDMESCKQKSNYEEKRNCWLEIQAICEKDLSRKSREKQSLQNIVSDLNAKIAYTQSQINQTEYEIETLQKEIETLSGKISILNISLDNLTKVLIRRISATYKQNKTNPLLLFFTSNGFSDFINRYSYLRAAQANDKKVMFELEQARADYDSQKTLKEKTLKDYWILFNGYLSEWQDKQLVDISRSMVEKKHGLIVRKLSIGPMLQ